MRHRFHQMGRQGLRAWPTSRLDRLDEAFKTSLWRLGVPRHELDEACDRTRRALVQVLSSDRGWWILSASQKEARCEYGLAGVLRGRVVRVKMDRTFVDSKGTRWIIDYKTGTHEGSDVDAFLDAEQDRYRPQLERYAALMALQDDRPLRLGLYFPLLNGWREWPARTADPLPAPAGWELELEV